ncbi:DsbA family protein [Mobilicoccus pelagius]|uniref:Peptidyl-prolyl cis-trans isomerase B n=1 Tax=Mobilicoccus pelagius NBRC 104925 TaxID=1089455 RepID=H5UVX3_9MICO|nr:thioredoxin domain-containing protein [Mobilicoccus pelagius]GAB49881.1 peptidyl-prolyl cis-trans isomerase B [Mobilicoccus pelagius NBRC 104925]
MSRTSPTGSPDPTDPRASTGTPGSTGATPQVVTDASRPRRRRGRAPLAAGIAGAALLVGALATGSLQGGPTPSASDTPAPSAPTSSTGSAAESSPGTVEELVAAMQRREKDDPLALGRVDAPVVLVEFSDWRCPFCGLWARNTRPALQKYVDDGTLRIEYRDLPIFGEESQLAARAGRAAAKQGRFWQFYDVVYGAAPERGHAALSPEKLVAFAREAGVADLERFGDDLASPQIATELERDLDDARRLGAPNSVPLFLVGTEALSGAQPTQVFVEAVERQAAAAR